MTCRICGGPSSVVARYDLSRVQPQWDRFPIDRVVELRRCRRYGSFFTGNLPPPEIIASQYEVDHDAYYANPGLSPARRAARCCALASQFIVPGGVVGDFGGGNGAFAIEAARAGFQSVLIELGQPPLDKLAAAGVRWNTSIEKESSESFDAIALWDVYEHFWPHAEIVAEFKRVLRPSGRLIIEIPSPSRLVPLFLAMGRLTPSPRRENALGHICNFTHLQLMTPKELHAELATLGFRVIHSETFSELSYAGYEYARRFVKWTPAAQLVGKLFDRQDIRKVLLGSNKTFVVAEKA